MEGGLGFKVWGLWLGFGGWGLGFGVSTRVYLAAAADTYPCSTTGADAAAGDEDVCGT